MDRKRNRNMMNSKSHMAEWILDFFRRNNCKANDKVMFHTVMLAMDNLNSKEKDLFSNVAKELINNGYMIFEQKPVQCIRLTAKGEEYVSNPNAVLDCCVDIRRPTEKILRDIIFLGQIVSTLQAYQDILKRGELVENLQIMENLFDNHQSKHQLRINTIKEYYGYLYRFFFLVCQLLTRLDDVSLRDVIFSYVEIVKDILKLGTNIQVVPMVQQINDMYVNALSTAKTNAESEKLQNFRNSLFA